MKLSKLYKTHQPTSLFQKVLLTAGSSLISVINPHRADMVATLGETTGCLSLKRMHQQMKNDTVSYIILINRKED